ncbi:zinc finger protein 33B-like isoform X2 [Cimex lectularius]|uniref:Zinc finger protein n=1 Tax=Cimex lectularius TaxID=79782 RepID=A0A8I6S9A7_CIMLE|nr:zinc finger protein 33B-like isoform X2 [Cimex lectularius]
MSGYRRVSFYELCRLCTTNEGVKVPIFDGEGRRRQIETKLQICLRLQVSEVDSLPKHICEPCLERLEGYFDFRANCVSAEMMLQSYASALQHNEDFKRDGTVYVKDNVELPNLQMALQNQELCTFNFKSDMNQASLIEGIVSTEEATNAAEIAEIVDDSLREQKMIVGRMNSVQDTLEDDISVKTEEHKTNNSEHLTGELIDHAEEECLEMIGLNEKEEERRICRLEPCSSDGIELGIVASSEFVCRTCTKCFKRKEHLNQHVKSHSVDRPFKCRSCSRSFNRKEHMMRHELCHTGQKEYICDICLKTFSRKDNVRKHRRTHEPSGPYTCEYCGKEFVIKPYYIMHRNAHITNGETPLELQFQCNICQKQFAKKDLLTQHLKKHKMTKTETYSESDKSECKSQMMDIFGSDAKIMVIKPISSGSKSIIEQALKQAG